MAGVLARLGLQASRTSVQRILKHPPPKKPPRKTGGSSHPVKAIRPGHVYVLDFTQIGGFFRSVAVGAVIDVFTRQVLAIRVWPREPGAASTTKLLQRAFDCSGRPAWVISDRGRQFRSNRFKGFLHRAGTRRRYVALGDANLSKIDRYWKTMKEEYGRGLLLFRPIRRLQKDLENYVQWFNTERPHLGLNHRSPEDVASGATLPSRRFCSGRLEVRYQNGDHELPIFRLRDAA
jgi:transposase InsO family protein